MNEKGKLNLNEWLDEIWVPENRECELCGCPSWIIDKNPVEIKQLNVKDEIIHMLMFVCKNCGNTKFINEIFFKT